MLHLLRLLLLCFFVSTLLLLQGCGSGIGQPKKTNWRPEYENLQKRPYSFFLIYESLPMLFPKATIEKQRVSSRLNNLGYTVRKQKKGKALVIMIGDRLELNDGEADSLLSLVEQGNYVMMATNTMDEKLSKYLKLHQNAGIGYAAEKEQEIRLRNAQNQLISYKYKPVNYSINSYFKPADTASPMYYTIGTNMLDKPDCIMYSIGEGKLILHASPLVFSNYFLLQNCNKNYLENLLSYVNEPVETVYFYSFNNRVPSLSDLGILWNNKATRLALILALCTLAVYILFEQKRRQKMIPELKPITNDSVAFVETIGRLYYNKKNHTNLAEKMIQHFLEFVRSNYYLDTSILDKEFVQNLSAKSGKEIAFTDTLVQQIKDINSGETVTESALYTLHNNIQQFYNGK